MNKVAANNVKYAAFFFTKNYFYFMDKSVCLYVYMSSMHLPLGNQRRVLGALS